MITINDYLVTHFPWSKYLSLYTGKISNNIACINELPDGWVISFILEWAIEIQKYLDTLEPEKRNQFQVIQLKEKYGSFRQYFSFYTPELQEIIKKYENVAEHTCISCGREGKMRTDLDWISPYCDECYERHIENKTHNI